jgi:hypothetical protein
VTCSRNRTGKTQTDSEVNQADSRSHAFHWHVDEAFAVHPDYRSHTGAIMSMGQGAINRSQARDEYEEFERGGACGS